MTGVDDGDAKPTIEAPSETLTDAWSRLLEAWDDDEAHRRFIALSHALGDLAFAGGQYRLIADQRNERETMARRQIDAVVAVAAAELFTHREPKPKHAPAMLIVALIVSTSMILYTLKLVFDMF